MTEWLDQLSLFMSGAMLMLSALELWFALIMPSASRWNRRFFIAIFTILLLCMGAGIVDLLTYRHSGMAWAQRISIYFEYLLITLPMPLFTVYLLGCCGENWRKSALWRAVLALWLVFSSCWGSPSSRHFCTMSRRKMNFAAAPGIRC